MLYIFQIICFIVNVISRKMTILSNVALCRAYSIWNALSVIFFFFLFSITFNEKPLLFKWRSLCSQTMLRLMQKSVKYLEQSFASYFPFNSLSLSPPLFSFYSFKLIDKLRSFSPRMLLLQPTGRFKSDKLQIGIPSALCHAQLLN